MRRVIGLLTILVYAFMHLPIIVIIIFFPQGIIGTINQWRSGRRQRRAAAPRQAAA